MKRKDFVRNTLLAIAASLVPRILQPAMGEVVQDGGFPKKFKSVSADDYGIEQPEAQGYYVEMKLRAAVVYYPDGSSKFFDYN